MDDLTELLAPTPVENQRQHPQNQQPVQFNQNRELPKQQAPSSHSTGRTGRTGPARGTLRVRVSRYFLSCISWSFLTL